MQRKLSSTFWDPKFWHIIYDKRVNIYNISFFYEPWIVITSTVEDIRLS